MSGRLSKTPDEKASIEAFTVVNKDGKPRVNVVRNEVNLFQCSPEDAVGVALLLLRVAAEAQVDAAVWKFGVERLGDNAKAAIFLQEVRDHRFAEENGEAKK